MRPNNANEIKQGLVQGRFVLKIQVLPEYARHNGFFVKVMVTMLLDGGYGLGNK